MPDPARVLDLTRLVSRLGRGPLTGVDRVELAYLTELLRRDGVLFGLVRTAAGYLLLDRGGARGVAALAAGAELGPADLLSRLTNRRNPLRARAEATVRRLALARCGRLGLRRLLRRVPRGASYVNVGHANLGDRALARLHRHCRVAVLVHDTIPLDHPGLCRQGTTAAFARKLAAIAGYADLVIHTTQDARAQTEAHLRGAGRVPSGVVAPLGVPVPCPAPLPPGLTPTRPYFVAVGTIEPRKNHALLVRVWTGLARHAPPPPLFILGSPGWAEPALFADLAATPGITVLSGLSDGEVAALVRGAAALVFPSLAEGFGLPPVEAAALGTPVIAADLPVLREVLQDYPVYLAPTDSYSWSETIMGIWLENRPNGGRVARQPPLWQDHFNTVLKLV